MSEEKKEPTTEQTEELGEADLEQVAGGGIVLENVQFAANQITINKTVVIPKLVSKF